jgi:uncharacterized protein (TIGR02284 family)
MQTLWDDGHLTTPWAAMSRFQARYCRSAGAQDFRDFSCLPAAMENRLTAAGPEGQACSTVRSTATADDSEREGTMSTDTQKNSEFEKVVKEVINILEDGQKGFADAGSHLKDETLKRYFLSESLKRANFRAELENELHRHGVHDVHESGTAAGTLHRVWFDFKDKINATDDHGLLANAEQGEDAAKKVYADALAQEIPLPLRQLLAEQNAHVVSSHDFIRDHRDALASN